MPLRSHRKWELETATYLSHYFLKTSPEDPTQVGPRSLHPTTMNADNIKSQMRKGYLEYCILLILKKKAAYASDIISELKDAKLIVVEGTLYPLLTRLKNSELLDYRWEESTQGPPRKYYEMTEKGIQFLDELEIAWDDINQVVQKIKSSPNPIDSESNS